VSGRACDLCGAARAPFGFAPPPRLGIPVRRPIWTCGARACRAAAEARVAALLARHGIDAGPPVAAPDAAQGRLFD
jgi:hypothetical protein